MTGLKYALLHALVHLSLALAIGYFLNLNFSGYLIALLATFLIDLDHISLIRKYGIKGSIYLRTVLEFSKPRKYPLHNIATIIVSGILTFTSFYHRFLFLGVVFLAVFLHMLWDLLEDVIVFKMGIKHWM